MPAFPQIDGWEWRRDQTTGKWALHQTHGKLSEIIARLTPSSPATANKSVMRKSISGAASILTNASASPPASPVSAHSALVAEARPLSVQQQAAQNVTISRTPQPVAQIVPVKGAGESPPPPYVHGLPQNVGHHGISPGQQLPVTNIHGGLPTGPPFYVPYRRAPQTIQSMNIHQPSELQTHSSVRIPGRPLSSMHQHKPLPQELQAVSAQQAQMPMQYIQHHHGHNIGHAHSSSHSSFASSATQHPTAHTNPQLPPAELPAPVPTSSHATSSASAHSPVSQVQASSPQPTIASTATPPPVVVSPPSQTTHQELTTPPSSVTPVSAQTPMSAAASLASSSPPPQPHVQMIVQTGGQSSSATPVPIQPAVPQALQDPPIQQQTPVPPQASIQQQAAVQQYVSTQQQPTFPPQVLPQQQASPQQHVSVQQQPPIQQHPSMQQQPSTQAPIFTQNASPPPVVAPAPVHAAPQHIPRPSRIDPEQQMLDMGLSHLQSLQHSTAGQSFVQPGHAVQAQVIQQSSEAAFQPQIHNQPQLHIQPQLQATFNFDPNTGQPIRPVADSCNATAPALASQSSTAQQSQTSPPLQHVNTSAGAPQATATSPQVSSPSAIQTTAQSQPPALTHTVSAPQVLQTTNSTTPVAAAKNKLFSMGKGVGKWISDNPKTAMAGVAIAEVGGLALGVDLLKDARFANSGLNKIRLIQRKQAQAQAAAGQSSQPARPPQGTSQQPAQAAPLTASPPAQASAQTINQAGGSTTQTNAPPAPASAASQSTNIADMSQAFNNIQQLAHDIQQPSEPAQVGQQASLQQQQFQTQLNVQAQQQQYQLQQNQLAQQQYQQQQALLSQQQQINQQYLAAQQQQQQQQQQQANQQYNAALQQQQMIQQYDAALLQDQANQQLNASLQQQQMTQQYDATLQQQQQLLIQQYAAQQQAYASQIYGQPQYYIQPNGQFYVVQQPMYQSTQPTIVDNSVSDINGLDPIGALSTADQLMRYSTALDPDTTAQSDGQVLQDPTVMTSGYQDQTLSATDGGSQTMATDVAASSTDVVGDESYIDTTTTMTTDDDVAVLEQTTTEVDFNADGSCDTYTETDVDVFEF